MSKLQLENIVKAAKIVIATTILSLSVYGCTGTKVSSPLRDYTAARVKGEPINCTETRENITYEKECVYPVIVVRF